MFKKIGLTALLLLAMAVPSAATTPTKVTVDEFQTSDHSYTIFLSNLANTNLSNATGVSLSTDLLFSSGGTYNIGSTGQSPLSSHGQNFILDDNFGDVVGSITEYSTGVQIAATYAVGGAFFGPVLISTADNGSGP